MRFKKILSFAFILLIILIAFTACSKQTLTLSSTATSIPVESYCHRRRRSNFRKDEKARERQRK